MSTYTDHADRAGLDTRLLVMASREARARYLATLAELDSGTVTLYMSKYELQSRLAEARFAHNDPDEGTACYGGWDK